MQGVSVKPKLEKYIKILKIELEDLHKDIEMYMERVESEKKCGEITNYVFMENLALIKNEIIGLDIINGYLDKLDLSEFSSIDKLANRIKEDLTKKLKEDGIAHALNIYLERKIDKVSEYLKKMDEF